ncbi:MAG TPA: pantoate--beta-alanine ligase [Caulobacteraceae bacterium]|jgi:pantoate--beta-alanine ligase
MSPIPVLRTPNELRAWRSGALGFRVALTPTMGALHDGHLSLIRLARIYADVVLASIFVNPTQFGPNEDFHAYPRDEARDLALLADAGCDAVYAPDAKAMYPPGFDTAVSVTAVAAPLEGAFRPRHFVGVATVVAKLMIQASPDFAVFGEKDYQQLQVIRRMALDLDLPVEIIGGPIVREPDGLALSSRNVYLAHSERAAAPALHLALTTAARALAEGEAIEIVEQNAREHVMTAGFESIDYLEVRHPARLERFSPGPLSGEARILAAARLGCTRLIDNIAATRRPVRADV